MFKLDDNLLRELGLGSLPPAEKNRMLGHIYETLEMRVGMKLAQRMSNDQLNEFEAFIDRGDEAGALKWLESNFPDYKQVVADELERLKSEVKQAAPQILAASQSQPIAPPPSQPSQQQQQPMQQPFGYQQPQQPAQQPIQPLQQPLQQPMQQPMPPQQPFGQPGQSQQPPQF